MADLLDNVRQGRRIGVRAVKVHDPSRDVQDVSDLAAAIEQGARGPSPWMQRALRRSQGVTVTPIGQAPKYLGRTCCFVHLSTFDGRLPTIGLQTTCPDCGAVFEFQLEAQP